jgi:hypothetical protein
LQESAPDPARLLQCSRKVKGLPGVIRRMTASFDGPQRVRFDKLSLSGSCDDAQARSG